MKTNESKPHNCIVTLLRHGHKVWKLLGKCLHRRKVGGESEPTEALAEQPVRHSNPLDRIKEYLLAHQLSRRVGVRFDADAASFVLEDDDGFVHARDYDEAVALINRMWL